ncbi:MBL fold metallo-hydrolase [Paenibacillus sp. GYB004]|uniref:MBL fold metallo-hydrolase n=1 Tax=Paenibacillus sp. GYB004 TaxID=2994393 RepID=UPI002F96A22F
MNLTVIGCWGAYPEKNEATSGYLVECEGSHILLDCGSGVLSRLQNHCALEQLDAVVLTHMHADHMADVYSLEFAILILMQIGRRSKPLDMYVNEKELGSLAFEYPDYVRVHPVRAGEERTIGHVRLQFSETVHEIPSLAVKLTSREGRTLVYSGDTGYCQAIIDLARSADVLMIESSFYDFQAGRMKGHLTAGEAGKIAALAGVGQTILTHFPHYGDLNQLVLEASRHYAGQIRLAYGGMQIHI